MQQASSKANELAKVQDCLKGLREARGWNQEQMAAHLDVTRSYYNQIETKNKPLKKGKLFNRAKVMLAGEFTNPRSTVNRPYTQREDPSLVVCESVSKLRAARNEHVHGLANDLDFTRDNSLFVATLEAEMYRVLEAFGSDDGGRNFDKEIIAAVCAYLREGASKGASSEVIYHDLLRRLPRSAWDYLESPEAKG